MSRAQLQLRGHRRVFQFMNTSGCDFSCDSRVHNKVMRTTYLDHQASMHCGYGMHAGSKQCSVLRLSGISR
jgi:hypothetical protein